MAHTARAWLVGNTMVITLITLRDQTGTPITDAVASATMIDDATGLAVAGGIFPIELAHIGGGTYRAFVANVAAVIPNGSYTVIVTATSGPDVYEARVPVSATHRDGHDEGEG